MNDAGISGISLPGVILIALVVLGIVLWVRRRR
jgi:uncharacterized protein (TIGR03382 family)